MKKIINNKMTWLNSKKLKFFVREEKSFLRLATNQ